MNIKSLAIHSLRTAEDCAMRCFFASGAPKYWFMGGFVLIGFLLRFAVLTFDPLLARDGILYLEQARIWHMEGAAELSTPPLFIWILKIFMDLHLPAAACAQILNAILGTLVVPFLAYWIARECRFSSKISRLVFLLTEVHPFLVQYSVEVLRDMPYLALAFAAILMILRGCRTGKTSCWIWAGLASGAAVLTRWEAFELFPATGLILAVRFGICRKIEWKLIRGYLVLVVLGGGIMLGGFYKFNRLTDWQILLSRRYDKFVESFSESEQP